MKTEKINSWGVFLEEIPPEGLLINFEEFIDIPSEYKVLQPFSGYLKIDKKGIEVLVRGELKGVLVLNCDRCLNPYEFPIHHLFNLSLMPKASLNVEEKKELTSEELEVSFYENDFISFEDILREEILLALPFKSLCQPDCKGLCPSCGKNLNQEVCGCKGFKKSSPFAILKDLLSNTKVSQGG